MASTTHSARRARARLWYTIGLVVIAALVALLGARLAGAAPPSTPSSQSTYATPIPLPLASTQHIQIESPAPETVVGSPMTITGRLAQLPLHGALAFRVFDGAGAPLGAGTFPVDGTPFGEVTFMASLAFRLPPDGGPIRLDLFDRDPRSPLPVALTSLGLFVTRPQVITIESPAQGSLSDGQVTVEGQTARLPVGARLAYSVLASDGRRLEKGTAPVAGADGRPAFFSVAIRFTPPPEGDTVTVVIADEDPNGPCVVATASLALMVAPQPQRIVVEKPRDGAPVTSPIAISGRTTRFPARGALDYAVFDSRDVLMGSGSIPVAGSPQDGGSFSAPMSFARPVGGGPLRIVLYERKVTGEVLASATLTVQSTPVAPLIRRHTRDQYAGRWPGHHRL